MKLRFVGVRNNDIGICV